MRSIEIETWSDECPSCKSKYENVGHPLTGAIMMRSCKCELNMQPIENGMIVIMTPPVDVVE